MHVTYILMNKLINMFIFFCSVAQSCRQLNARGKAKQKALWHNPNSALKLRQASGSGEPSPGKQGFIKRFKFQGPVFDLCSEN